MPVFTRDSLFPRFHNSPVTLTPQARPAALKILFFCPNYLPLLGGGEWATHLYAQDLVCRGHGVVVATGTAQPAGVPIRNLDGIRILHTPEQVPDFLRWFQVARPDLVVATQHWSEPACAALAGTGVPLVIFGYGHHQMAQVALAGRAAVPRRVVVCSNALADDLEHLFPQRPLVVHPPLDRWRVTSPDSGSEPRDRISMVNLSFDKGGGMFQSLARSCPDRLFLAGEGGWGNQFPVAGTNVERLKAPLDLPALFRRTRVFLMPSWSETFGMVAVEAQANGVPVIASDLPGLREATGDGALFVPAMRLSDWMEALRRLDDPEEYALLANKARKNAQRLLDAREPEADALEDELRRVAGRAAPPRRRSSVLPEAPALSYLVPHRNRSDLLDVNLDSLSRQTRRDFEVVIIDNSDTPEEVEKLRAVVRRWRATGLGIRCVRVDPTRSVYYAPDVGAYCNPSVQWNVAARQARGHVVVLTSPEVVNARTNVETLVALFERRGDSQFVYGRVEELPREEVEPLLDDLSVSRLARLFAGRTAQDNAHCRPDTWQGMQFFLGAMARSEYIRLGGMDERMMGGLCGDDPDFSERAFLGGLEPLLAREVLGVHLRHPRAYPSAHALTRRNTLRLLAQRVEGQNPVANETDPDWGGDQYVVEVL